ncbi:acyl-CoA N-acyltransferase [Echria macrotheca]|uniref:Acyl-CoA N-acyltransferase n=1 Tax=Echria macrotheca TaxID=438768 RepID=A0AAJ0BJI6_9PEZI|nr:acyl-CoA N-acyltransferase [Echria macrotheca]
MAWKIEGCTVSDGDAIARNNASAFWFQPYWRILWPADMQQEFIVTQARKRLASAVLLRARDTTRHEKVVDEQEDRVVGYARWALPDAYKNEWLDRQVPAVSPEVAAELKERADSAWWKPRNDMGELDRKVDEERDRVLAIIPPVHMELEYLAVHPDHQRKGIARSLVESGIREADRLGLPIFVLAFNVSLELYQKLGFRELGRVLQDDSKFGGDGQYNTYFLLYEPGKGASGRT